MWLVEAVDASIHGVMVAGCVFYQMERCVNDSLGDCMDSNVENCVEICGDVKDN